MRREHRYLTRHHGVISRSEAIEVGLSDGQIRARLRSGRWERIGPQVFRLAGAPATWLGSARALALSTGGCLSHRAAARLWGLDGFGRAALEVTVATGVRRGANASIGRHRSTQMHLASPIERRAVRCTGIARTVLDLAGVVDTARLQEIVDEVLRRKLVTWPGLYEVLVRHARRGRPGVANLRALLDCRYGEQTIPDSRWNRMVWQLLVDAGLPEPDVEFVVRDGRGCFRGRLDLAYPDARLGIELDSRRFHLNDRSFVADRRRSNGLGNAGWRLLHFTWETYAKHPDDVVRTVRDALAVRPAIIAR